MTTKERVTELIERFPEDFSERFSTMPNISILSRNTKSGLGFHWLIWPRVMRQTRLNTHWTTSNDEAG